MLESQIVQKSTK